ncbi:MAG TPA: hypothetical protein ENF64_00455 [Hadesarchaea archaeon]|nr:hypothetical protein [Hadesarchaea archaeon]
MPVQVVRIGNISEKVVKSICKSAEKDMAETPAGKFMLGPALNFPPRAYNPSRKQYNSDLLLSWLYRNTDKKSKILGLINVDLYTESRALNFIFGQAQCPGKVAIVSIYRLNPIFYGEKSNLELLIERATKEVVHELGHTFGLKHCPNPECVMSFSPSILDVDKKSSTFCVVCRNKQHSK